MTGHRETEFLEIGSHIRGKVFDAQVAEFVEQLLHRIVIRRGGERLRQPPAVRVVGEDDLLGAALHGDATHFVRGEDEQLAVPQLVDRQFEFVFRVGGDRENGVHAFDFRVDLARVVGDRPAISNVLPAASLALCQTVISRAGARFKYARPADFH